MIIISLKGIPTLCLYDSIRQSIPLVDHERRCQPEDTIGGAARKVWESPRNFLKNISPGGEFQEHIFYNSHILASPSSARENLKSGDRGRGKFRNNICSSLIL